MQLVCYGDLSVRLSLVDFDGGRTKTAIKALPPGAKLYADILKTYCGNVVTAVNRLCRFVAE